MTTKVKGAEGIEFPDATVQESAADKGPAAWAILTPASQAISTLNAWGIPVLTEQFDTNNCFLNGQFIPNVEGYYQINGSCNFTAASGLAGIAARIVKSGNAIARSYAMSATGVDGGISVSALIYMNGTTDWIELQGLITAGVSPVFSPAITQLSASLARKA